MKFKAKSSWDKNQGEAEFWNIKTGEPMPEWMKEDIKEGGFCFNCKGEKILVDENYYMNSDLWYTNNETHGSFGWDEKDLYKHWEPV